MHITRLDHDAHTAALLMAVEHNSLGDSDYSVSEAQAVLADPCSLTFGAWQGDALVGFLFCLWTVGPRDPRLELDMLGVLPYARRQGIAKALVGRALDEGRCLAAASARAVIAVDNAASRRAFMRNGFSVRRACRMMAHSLPTESQPQTPYVRGERHVALNDGQDLVAVTLRVGADLVELVRVDTLSYAGFWAEQLPPTRAAALAAVDYAAQYPIDEVGHLLSVGCAEQRDLLLSLGWADCGGYDVLTRDL